MSTPAVAGEGEQEAAGRLGMGWLGCAPVAGAAARLQVPGAWAFVDAAAAAAAGMMREGFQSCTAGTKMSAAVAVAAAVAAVVAAVAAAAVAVAVAVPLQQQRHLAAC